MEALGEYVLIRFPRELEQTESGIKLASQGRDAIQYWHGRVESIGEEAEAKLKGKVAKGKYVLFEKDGITLLKLDPLSTETQLLTAHYTQVFAVMPQEEVAQLKLPLVEDDPE